LLTFGELPPVPPVGYAGPDGESVLKSVVVVCVCVLAEFVDVFDVGVGVAVVVVVTVVVVVVGIEVVVVFVWLSFSIGVLLVLSFELPLLLDLLEFLLRLTFFLLPLLPVFASFHFPVGTLLLLLVLLVLLLLFVLPDWFGGKFVCVFCFCCLFFFALLLPLVPLLTLLFVTRFGGGCLTAEFDTAHTVEATAEEGFESVGGTVESVGVSVLIGNSIIGGADSDADVSVVVEVTGTIGITDSGPED